VEWRKAKVRLLIKTQGKGAERGLDISVTIV
jgi:hypothetical protein